MTATVVLSPAATPGQGGGHVTRCVALARALEAQGAACRFVIEPWGADILRRQGRTGPVETWTTLAERRAAILAAGPDAVVLDDYRLDAAFEAELPAPVLVIDDLADRPHACALLLDSAHGRLNTDYARLAPGARLLLGPEYAPLREGFGGLVRDTAEVVRRVFVCFGLSDPGGITTRALPLLRPLLPHAVFDVALGGDAPSVGALRQIAKADPGIVLHLDADVAPLMRAADLGVGAGGGMVWERRAAGLPQLVVALADNQRPMCRRLAAEGVIALVDVAEPDFEYRLPEALARLLPRAVRQAQLDDPTARCDGQGANRVAAALMQALPAR